MTESQHKICEAEWKRRHPNHSGWNTLRLYQMNEFAVRIGIQTDGSEPVKKETKEYR